MQRDGMWTVLLLVFLKNCVEFATATSEPSQNFAEPGISSSILGEQTRTLWWAVSSQQLVTSSTNIESGDKQRFQNLCERTRYELTGYTNKQRIEYVINQIRTTEIACTWLYTCELLLLQDGFCPVLVDGLGTCFFPTAQRETATSSCPSFVSGIPYDTTKNVSRACQEDGTWINKSNYSECKPILDNGIVCDGLKDYFGTAQNKLPDDKVDLPCKSHFHNLALIAYVGRGLSLSTLAVAFVLFWMLRSIRCWRNIIHWNLTASLILRNAFWIFLHSFIDHESRMTNTISCRILVTIFNYTQATNYFWMFVEGLYLHMMVVLAYTHDRIKLHVYLAIGWGAPIPLTIVWIAVKMHFEDHTCWMPDLNESKMADYFIQIPIIIMLFVNAIILANIVRILVTKLKTGYTTRDTNREMVKFKKAVKAALFLFPLLGVNYVIFFLSPSSDPPGQIVFLYFNTCMQSFQGFFVCTIYCFANGEIQKALQKKMNIFIWENRCLCCFWRKKNHNQNRRVSSVSLSRTTHTFLSLRSRDGGCMRQHYCAKSPVMSSRTCTPVAVNHSGGVSTSAVTTDRRDSILPVRVSNYQTPGLSDKFTNDESGNKSKEEMLPLVSVEINREYEALENFSSEHAGLTSKIADVDAMSHGLISCTNEKENDWRSGDSSADDQDQSLDRSTTKNSKWSATGTIESENDEVINDQYLVDAEIGEELE